MPLPYTMSRNHVNPQGLQLHGGIELHGGHRVQAHLRRLHGVLLGAAGGEDVQLALPGLIVDQPLLLQFRQVPGNPALIHVKMDTYILLGTASLAQKNKDFPLQRLKSILFQLSPYI